MGLALTHPIDLLRANGVPQWSIILLSEVGSSAHGIISASEDTDYTAVFIQDIKELVNGTKESRMIRTALEGQRSGPNDIDVNVYSLRKFARLAENGNPSILTALFSEKKLVQDGSFDFEELATLIRSKRVGYAFLGYMNEQLNRWQGKSSKRVSRPELVEAHGYDTKYASHVIRLGAQGIEYMKEGRFSVPMDVLAAQFISGIRAGDMKEQEALRWAEKQREALEQAVEASSFPEKSESIDEWLTDAYSREYGI